MYCMTYWRKQAYFRRTTSNHAPVARRAADAIKLPKEGTSRLSAVWRDICPGGRYR